MHREGPNLARLEGGLATSMARCPRGGGIRHGDRVTKNNEMVRVWPQRLKESRAQDVGRRFLETDSGRRLRGLPVRLPSLVERSPGMGACVSLSHVCKRVMCKGARAAERVVHRVDALHVLSLFLERCGHRRAEAAHGRVSLEQ
eukprot:scaffold53008_cov32-Tisochrysis_lutea.AAC.1